MIRPLTESFCERCALMRPRVFVTRAITIGDDSMIRDNFGETSGPGECARMTATHVLLTCDQPSLCVLSLSLSLPLASADGRRMLADI